MNLVELIKDQLSSGLMKQLSCTDRCDRGNDAVGHHCRRARPALRALRRGFERWRGVPQASLGLGVFRHRVA